MAKLVDALALGANGVTRGGSSPLLSTIKKGLPTESFFYCAEKVSQLLGLREDLNVGALSTDSQEGDRETVPRQFFPEKNLAEGKTPLLSTKYQNQSEQLWFCCIL